jgi:hypothetical protein
VFRFAICVTLLAVTPLGTVTVHEAYAASVAVPAARLSVASSWPDAATVGVNTVDPHPVKVTSPVAVIPVIANVGSFNRMLSVECTSGIFRANVNEITVTADVTGVSIVNTLCMNKGAVGCATAVDKVIAVVLAMSAASANVTPTFRDASFALCGAALVVTPVSIATVHLV